MAINKQKIIVIIGPTASGKTALAEQLALRFHGEIISADARQVYRGMDIGTAKTKNSTVPYHLIDIRKPDEKYTAAYFRNDAISIIDEIIRRDHLPFVVGGTGLYVSALVDNLTFPSVPPNQKLRTDFEQKSAEYLANILNKKDPETARSIDLKNKRRLIRALEVIAATGESFTRQKTKGKPRFDALMIGMRLPREELYARINQRVDEMIKNGLVSEVRTLLKRYPAESPAFNAIGYKEIIEWIQTGETAPLDKVSEKIKQATRRYARRQLTWFRRDPRIHWIGMASEAEHLIFTLRFAA